MPDVATSTLLSDPDRPLVIITAAIPVGNLNASMAFAPRDHSGSQENDHGTLRS